MNRTEELGHLLLEITEIGSQEIAYERTAQPNPFARGRSLQGKRLMAAARYSASQYSGQLLEIGCLVGETSVLLAQVAREFGRTLLCLDPWESGTQNCTGVEYDQFLENTADYSDVIEVLRMSSLTREAIEELGKRELCFSFVDGLHTGEAVTSDMNAVQHTSGIVAVDDLRWSVDIKQAFFRMASRPDFDSFYHPVFREGYLWRAEFACPVQG